MTVNGGGGGGVFAFGIDLPTWSITVVVQLIYVNITCLIPSDSRGNAANVYLIR